MSGDAPVERSAAMLDAAAHGEVTASGLAGVQAAIGIGYGVLAIAEAATRIADAFEASRKGDRP